MTTFNDAKVEHFFETAKYFQKNLINLFCSLLYSIFIVYLSYIYSIFMVYLSYVVDKKRVRMRVES